MVEGLDRQIGRAHAHRRGLTAHARDVEVIDRPFLGAPRDDGHAVRRDGQGGAGEMRLVAFGRMLQLDPRTERDAVRRGAPGGRRGEDQRDRREAARH